eukprot:8138539-Alexandrium_andersonii.AAC.1
MARTNSGSARRGWSSTLPTFSGTFDASLGWSPRSSHPSRDVRPPSRRVALMLEVRKSLAARGAR